MRADWRMALFVSLVAAIALFIVFVTPSASGNATTDTGQPNLAVTPIKVSPSAPNAGDSVQFRFLIVNTGKADAVLSYDVSVTGETQTTAVPVSSRIPPCDTITVLKRNTGCWVQRRLVAERAGLSSITVTLDPSNTVGETRETDNVRTKQFSVRSSEPEVIMCPAIAIACTTAGESCTVNSEDNRFVCVTPAGVCRGTCFAVTPTPATGAPPGISQRTIDYCGAGNVGSGCSGAGTVDGYACILQSSPGFALGVCCRKGETVNSDGVCVSAESKPICGERSEGRQCDDSLSGLQAGYSCVPAPNTLRCCRSGDTWSESAQQCAGAECPTGLMQVNGACSLPPGIACPAIAIPCTSDRQDGCTVDSENGLYVCKRQSDACTGVCVNARDACARYGEIPVLSRGCCTGLRPATDGQCTWV